MTSPFSALVLLHGGCGVLYTGLATLILLRRPPSRTGVWLAGACLVTAGWAGSVALTGSSNPLVGIAGWLEVTRSVAWYGFILHLYRRSVVVHRQLRQAFTTMGLLALLLVGGWPLIDALARHSGDASLWSVGIAIRLGFAVCNILLLENLYYNTPIDARWHINLLCVALAGIFLYDLVLYADAALFRRVSQSLFEGRASAIALAAPFIALAAARNRRWAIDIHVSRDVVFHTATLVVCGVFLLGLAVTGEIFRHGGAEWGNVAEVSLIFGGLLVVTVLLTSGTARSHFRSILVDNFFSHRYDYRREWMRCIDTLTAPAAHTGLSVRAIRAAAELVDSPAGVLFVRAPEEVSFQWAGSWNMPAATQPIPPGHRILAEFRDANWVIELDKLAPVAELAELPRTWLAVPLNHQGNLIGFVVLARSRAHFKLDREVFDLLRIIGREVASRVAEQLAAQVLSQTQQLRAYSQRFAFVIHDIKNVSGQLSMLLTNAEVHADNPEFQRDMLATVRASVDKITRLLMRLQADQKERSYSLIRPIERLKSLVDAVAQISEVDIELTDDGGRAGVAIDPESFDAVVQHLLNNAIEASSKASTVRVHLRHEPLSVVVDIIDEGSGMSPEFIRDELFRPFATTKGGGHGIGAYQARELLRAAGGDLLVLSRRPGGTTMRLLLPSVRLALADIATQPA